MVRRIGAGAFATVWLAHDDQLDSAVAVKVLAENWVDDTHVRRRFVEEGRYLRRVESPHLVSVYDAGELDDGRPYLVMTYADRGNLADRLEAEGFTPAQALTVVQQVAAGLQALHDADIIHRDVKPANVLFRTVGNGSGHGGGDEGEVRAVVGDLGLGKALEGTSRLTVIAGTPSYVSPEQARGERADARTDQFSLGALAYLMLSGRPAYRHESLAAATAPPAPAPLGAGLPAAADEVVRRALADDRDDRWPTVTAFADALGEALAEVTGPSRSVVTRPTPSGSTRRRSQDPDVSTQPERRPRPRAARLAVGVAAVLTLLGGAAAGWYAAARLAGEPTVQVEDDRGMLSARVPADWSEVDAEGWTPAGVERAQPAVVAAADDRWPGGDGPGVFLGVVPGQEVPPQVGDHPECGVKEGPSKQDHDGRPAVTAFFTDCPGGVTAERYVQLTDQRLLWVQVRAEDEATLREVLDSVDVHGV